MKKKDVIFLAASLILGEKTNYHTPPDDESKDTMMKDEFNSWYRFLYSRYDQCQD